MSRELPSAPLPAPFEDEASPPFGASLTPSPAVGPVASPSTMPMIPALPTLSLGELVGALEPDVLAAHPAPAFPFDRLESRARRGRPRIERDGAGRIDGRFASLYYLARNGIYHGLRALGVGAGATVLMPSYHHGVEVEAVRRAGAEVAFYRVDRALRADLDDARRLARATSARVLYLTHYAGFAQPVDEAVALARDEELLLVEDCALSLYSAEPSGRPLGTMGDLAIFCLYKTLPVPHGGLALSSRPLPRGDRPPLLSTLHHLAGSLRAHAALRAEGSFPEALGEAFWEAARGLAGKTIDRAVSHEHTGTQHLDPKQLRLGASWVLPRLLSMTDARRIVVRRRRNFRLLAWALGDDAALSPRPLEPGVCPLFFPLIVPDRARALAAFEAARIEAVDFWSVFDPRADEHAFPDAGWLRRHLIELPIHQSLDDEAILRVARVVKSVLGHA